MKQPTWLALALAFAIGGATSAVTPAAAAVGTIETVAGNGRGGYGGDGGAATSASLNAPRTVAVDAAGNVYVADTENHVIRRIDPSGSIVTVAGTGAPGFSGDGGLATAARIESPHSVAVDASSNIYIADSPNNRVRRVDPAGEISTVAGAGASGDRGDGGPATLALLDDPKSIAVAADGVLYIADSGNHRVRKVDRNGIITTFAGTGEEGAEGDGGPATAAQVTHPRTIALHGDGSLYISEDTEAQISRIRRVDPSGIITRFAGTGRPGFSGDGGPATSAQLNRPRGLSVDPAGNVYIADSENHRIRRVDPSGIISTIAGTGVSGSKGDGGLAREAQISVVRGLAIGRNGDLFVADTGNHRIRRIGASLAASGSKAASGSRIAADPGRA